VHYNRIVNIEHNEIPISGQELLRVACIYFLTTVLLFWLTAYYTHVLLKVFMRHTGANFTHKLSGPIFYRKGEQKLAFFI